MTTIPAPKRTTRRLLVAAYIVGGLLVVLGVLIAAGLATGVLAVYDAPGNAGVTLTNVGGFEWRGTPGWFSCDGQC